MTKKEHLVEVELDISEEVLERMKKLGWTPKAVIECYADADEYGWTEHLEQSEIKELFKQRIVFMEQIILIDNRIDAIIEGDSNCNREH